MQSVCFKYWGVGKLFFDFFEKFRKASNTPVKTTDEEQGWVPLDKVDREKFVDWMTRSVLSKNRRSVIPGLDTEKLIKKEVELNMKCFIIDDHGWPRFVEKIMGVTNDLGKLEFVTKFKYCNQGHRVVNL